MASLTRAQNAIARVLGQPTVNELAHPALESPATLRHPCSAITIARLPGTLQAERP
jgi:hypothetical protein